MTADQDAVGSQPPAPPTVTDDNLEASQRTVVEELAATRDHIKRHHRCGEVTDRGTGAPSRGPPAVTTTQPPPPRRRCGMPSARARADVKKVVTQVFRRPARRTPRASRQSLDRSSAATTRGAAAARRGPPSQRPDRPDRRVRRGGRPPGRRILGLHRGEARSSADRVSCAAAASMGGDGRRLLTRSRAALSDGAARGKSDNDTVPAGRAALQSRSAGSRRTVAAIARHSP